jgi:hypothetical protein
MKTKTVLSTGLGVLLLASPLALGSYIQMSAEVTSGVDIGNGNVGENYKIYVEVEDGARLDAVYGSSEAPLWVEAQNGATFYQHQFGGNATTNVNQALLGAFASLHHDSWVTIGHEHDNSSDATNPNALSLQGLDFSDFAGGTLTRLETDNGSWYVTPDDAQGAEEDGKILVGQFTLIGGLGDVSDLDGIMNFQGKTPDGEDNWSMEGVWIPAPGAMALLGLAGIAGRRRRR